MTQPLRIGIAGLGTVGAGIVKLLQEHGDAAGPALRPRRSRSRRSRRATGSATAASISPAIDWFDDPLELADDPDVDVVVELIGGSDGVAKALVETAIARAASMWSPPTRRCWPCMARRWRARRQRQGVALAYEAAVAGGIPIIKTLREGLAANRIERVYGILNGTCNYILTTMRETGREFADVLAEAQKLGYAEADPSFDVDGIDAAHKLAILTSVAFGCGSISPASMSRASATCQRDRHRLCRRTRLPHQAARHRAADRARASSSACIPAWCRWARRSPMSRACSTRWSPRAISSARTWSEGRGAGAGPTASAVVADLIDIARGRTLPAFAIPAAQLDEAAGRRRWSATAAAYYLRLMVVDRPGVIADVTAALRDEEVSLEAMLQRGRAPGEAVPVVLTTHETDGGRDAPRAGADRRA